MLYKKGFIGSDDWKMQQDGPCFSRGENPEAHVGFVRALSLSPYFSAPCSLGQLHSEAPSYVLGKLTIK